MENLADKMIKDIISRKQNDCVSNENGYCTMAGGICWDCGKEDEDE